MRKTVKVLHTLAAAGLIGGLGAYMVLLLAAPQATPEAYADLRQSIAAISNYVLLPSLAVALISGLVSMVVQPAFLDKGWVLIKAVSGILMFKGVLTIVGAKADYAAAVSRRILAGEAPPDALEGLIALEWGTLIVVMAISVANVVLGVWRPRIVRDRPPRRGRGRVSAPAPVSPARAPDASPPSVTPDRPVRVVEPAE